MFYYTPTLIYDFVRDEIIKMDAAYACGDVIAAAMHLLRIEQLLNIYVKF